MIDDDDRGEVSMLIVSTRAVVSIAAAEFPGAGTGLAEIVRVLLQRSLRKEEQSLSSSQEIHVCASVV